MEKVSDYTVVDLMLLGEPLTLLVIGCPGERKLQVSQVGQFCFLEDGAHDTRLTHRKRTNEIQVALVQLAFLRVLVVLSVIEAVVEQPGDVSFELRKVVNQHVL